MNLFSRVILSLKRNLSRTAVLFLLIFVLGTFVSSAISIQQGIIQTERNLRRRLPPVVTIEHDIQAMEDYVLESLQTELTDSEAQVLVREFWYESRVTPAMISKIGLLPQVAEYDIAQVLESHSELQPAPPSNTDIAELVERNTNDDFYFFLLNGVNRPSFSDINTGLVEIVEGRTFTEAEINGANMGIISAPLAEVNNLTVGSIAALSHLSLGDFDLSSGTFQILAQQDFELEIIGIFELTDNLVATDELEMALSEIELLNQIYVPFQITEDARLFHLENVVENSVEMDEEMVAFIERYFSEGSWNRVLFLLEDPVELDEFERAAKEILPPFWKVVGLSNVYANISGALGIVDQIAQSITWVSFGVAIVSLSLLIMLFFHDRKHEIGIYLALGEKRIKVILGLLIEVLTVGMIATTMSLFVGNILALQLSETLLTAELMNQQHLDEYMPQGHVSGMDPLRFFAPPEFDIEELLEDYSITLNRDVVFSFFGLSFVILIISTLLPILYITQIKPKRILL